MRQCLCPEYGVIESTEQSDFLLYFHPLPFHAPFLFPWSLRPARYKNFGSTTSPLLDIVRNHEKMRIPKFQNHRLTATFARVNLQFRLFWKNIHFFGKTSNCPAIYPFFRKNTHWSSDLSLNWSVGWWVSYSVRSFICESVGQLVHKRARLPISLTLTNLHNSCNC